MVLLQEPLSIDPNSTPLGMGLLQEWQSIDRGVVMDVQQYQLGEAGKAWSQLKSLAMSRSTSGSLAPFRVITSYPPFMELAQAKTAEEALEDADLLKRFMAGASPASSDLIPEALVAVLCQAAREAAREGRAQQQEAVAGGDAMKLEAVAQWSAPDVLQALEPWAATLVDNADKLRYACYAFRIASALAADGSTAGLGGDEVVKLCFAAVDAAIASSWFSWFTKSLLDDSPASNVVRRTLDLGFEGGPQRIIEQVCEMSANMRREDVEQVTRLANALKRRVAVLVGDIIALFLPNDANLSNVLVTEMIMKLTPTDATSILTKLSGYYEHLPLEHRSTLEKQDSLQQLVTSTSAKVKGALLSEYDLPLMRKAHNAFKRQAKLSKVSIVFPPLRAVVVAGGAINAVGTAGIGAGVGRSQCESVFVTLDGMIPVVAVTIQRSLAIAFGTIVLLARCADNQSEGVSSGGMAGSALRVLEAAGRLAPGATSATSGRQ